MAIDPVTGMIIGGGLSALGSIFGGGNDEQKAKVEPWGPASNYLKSGLNLGARWLGSNYPQPYPYSAISPFTPAETASQEFGLKRGFYGSPLQGIANQTMGNILGGRNLYTGTNPYFQFNYRSGARDITENWLNNIFPALRTQAQLAGAANQDQEGLLLGESQKILGRSLGDLYGNMANSYYSQGLGQQNQMMGLMPTYAGMDWSDIAKMSAIGEAQRALSDRYLGEQKDIWNFGQNRDLQRAQNYLNIGLPIANMGQTSTQTNPYGTNPFAAALGGMQTGYGLYNMLAGSPTAPSSYQLPFTSQAQQFVNPGTGYARDVGFYGLPAIMGQPQPSSGAMYFNTTY